MRSSSMETRLLPLDITGFSSEECRVLHWMYEQVARGVRTDYFQMGAELGALVASKQEQYGDSVGKSAAVMRVLYPEGIAPHQYDDVLLVVRVLDKLSRIAQRGEDNADRGGESPWTDISGYGLLGAAKEAAHGRRTETHRERGSHKATTPPDRRTQEEEAAPRPEDPRSQTRGDRSDGGNEEGGGR